MRRWMITLAVLLTAAAVYFLWPRHPGEILPADPNPFVRHVTVLPIELQVDESRGDRLHADPLPLVTAPDAIRPFEDVIEIPSRAGQYLLIDLDRNESPPATIDGSDVSEPNWWPITFAVYRLGDPEGESACEFSCHCSEGTIPLPPISETGQHPPPMLPVIGRTLRNPSDAFVGFPDIGVPPEGHNRYWTFVVPPDRERPEGDYVYEVRLYPTAHWVSAVRWETGQPIVLRRGLLVAIDETKSTALAHDGGGDN